MFHAPMHNTGDSDSDDFSYLDWYNLIERYSDLSITCPKDRLPAIAGLARLYSNLNRTSYLAGLWKEDIVCGLQWTAERHESSSDSNFVPRRSHPSAPTWSWASVEFMSERSTDNSHAPGPLIKFTIHLGTDPMFKVLEMACTVLDAESPFGEVTSGELVIEGLVAMPIAATTIWNRYDTLDCILEFPRWEGSPSPPHLPNFLNPNPNKTENYCITVPLDVIPPDEDLNSEQPIQISASELRCVRTQLTEDLHDTGGLLLRVSTRENGKYERLGRMNFFDHQRIFEWAEAQTIAIV